MYFLNLGKVNRRITVDYPNTCRYADLQKVSVCTSSCTLCGFFKFLPQWLVGKTSCCLKLVPSHSEPLLCMKEKPLLLFHFTSLTHIIHTLCFVVSFLIHFVLATHPYLILFLSFLIMKKFSHFLLKDPLYLKCLRRRYLKKILLLSSNKHMFRFFSTG